MSFVIPWLWYLLAFVAGSLVAYGAVIVSVKQTSKHDALAAASARGDKRSGANE